MSGQQPAAGSELVQLFKSRDGAWRRIIIGGGRGNLLSLDLVRALGDVLHQLESERGIKWLTFEGSGGEFSYGAKIQEHTPELMQTVLPETHRLMKRVLAFPAPTAALVEGRCLGGRFQLAMSCEHLIATQLDEFFALPGKIRLGGRFSPPVAGRAPSLPVLARSGFPF